MNSSFDHFFETAFSNVFSQNPLLAIILMPFIWIGAAIMMILTSGIGYTGPDF